MKILHFAGYYYPHIGGIEQVALDAVNALSGQAEQRVICFHHEKKNAVEEINGVQVTRAKCVAKVASQPISLSFGKLLKKQFREFQPDILIFHYPNPLAAHYVLKALKKHPECKLILYWHLDITKQKILGKLFKGQNKHLLQRAEKIVATSPNYIEGSPYLSQFKEKCTVVPNCVNTQRMGLGEASLDRAHEIRNAYQDKTICFAIGRHVPYKGMEYLVRASKLLDDNIRIFIGGQGELTDSLKKLASQDKKIEFLGKIDDTTLKAYMHACDIFCFPSVTKNEAFGIALAEAMSYGKPAVTFTIEGSGVNFVSLNGVTGIEVENANAEAYAQAIRKLAEDKELREEYGKAARERTQALFSEQGFKDSILKLIQM